MHVGGSTSVAIVKEVHWGITILLSTIVVGTGKLVMPDGGIGVSNRS